MKSVTKSIRYIGCDDADLRLFESQYFVPKGMCYNSYVILDEKVAVMDTSDRRTLGQWKTNLTEALDGRNPDYLIVHHLEPDHASGIGEVLDMFPEIQIVCSAKAQSMMPLYFPQSDIAGRVMAVKEGDTLCLGEHTLQFFTAPMVHWPEVMVSYDAYDKVLFSADAFGKFGTMDSDPDDWTLEARPYYFNVCGKYGVPVSTLLKKVSGLSIEQILPLHGPILSGEKMAEALRLYTLWSSYSYETDGICIAHASIHGCTKAAIGKLVEILRAKGCENISVTDLCRENHSKAIADAFKYSKLILAASSYDGGVFPPMQDFIHHLQIKTLQKRDVAIIENGSWAPCAGKVMKQMVEGMKDMTVKGETVTMRGILKESDIPALEALADAILA